MTLLRLLAVTDMGKQAWFWSVTVTVVGSLLLLNVLLIVVVHAHHLRENRRSRRAESFRRRFERLLAEQGPGTADVSPFLAEARQFGKFERPLAAAMVVERLREASPEDRKQALEWLRRVGAIDVLLRSTQRWQPWRRALAVRTLGIVGAAEAVPRLIECLSDRSRYVREAAVRALGRIGDERALPALGQLYADPGSVALGVVYEALRAFGAVAAPMFGRGLHSPDENVRVASVFGIGSALAREVAAPRLADLLADRSPLVRAAAARVLERVGDGSVPEGLRRVTGDAERSVRRAAVSALASYDDPEALRLALRALGDPDRDTAVRAGETMVRLTRRPSVGGAARRAVAVTEAWPLEHARLLATPG